MFTFILSGIGIVALWKQLGQTIKTGWIPIFFWLIVSNVGWACANNMLENTMTVFVVFAAFKLAQLKEFAYGFQSYDLIAKNNLLYGYAYPFIQAGLGLSYLSGFGSIGLNIFVVAISLVSGAGVLYSLHKKQAVHCVCLGNVIKLPLSRISFVEDFGMAVMALAMIILR